MRSCMFSYNYYFLSTICHEATTQQAFNYIPKDKYFGVQKVSFFLLQFFSRAEKQGYSGKSIDFKVLLLSCFFHPFWLPIFFSKSFLNSCLKLEKTPVCHEKWLFRFLKNLNLTFLKSFHNFVKLQFKPNKYTPLMLTFKLGQAYLLSSKFEQASQRELEYCR